MIIARNHISHTFKESNIRSVVKAEGVELYKHAELKGSKLEHEPSKSKYFRILSLYHLSNVEQSLLCKGW